MNGILREVIARGWIDDDYVAEHTTGFESLAEVVQGWTTGRVADVCGVPADGVRAAAELVGTCDRLLSTALQGFHQSTRRRRRPARSTTSTCCAACSAGPVRGSTR